MSNDLLQTIAVEDLQAGMFVHAIAEQNGALEVKSRGRISSTSVIKQLQKQGIVTVVIDHSKSDERVSHEPAASSLPSDSSTLEEPPTARKKLEDIDMELNRVDRLMLQCSKTHKRFVIEAKKDQLNDLSAAQEIAHEIHKSLERNPNALLCISAIKNSPTYLAHHAVRVSVLICYFAQTLGIKEKDCRELALLGYLYDIGMTQLPPEMFAENKPLIKDEWKQVQMHPQAGAKLLEGLGLSKSSILAVEQHHERLDGSGYPKQLKGEMINKYARLLAIVDAYDAMTYERPFRKAISPVQALKTILNPDNGFDLKLANAFTKCLGIYPVGSLVLLSNQRIAIVTQQHAKKPKMPKVKVFYSTTGSHYMEPKEINLDGNTNDLKIEKPVLASTYNIDLNQVFSNI